LFLTISVLMMFVEHFLQQLPVGDGPSIRELLPDETQLAHVATLDFKQ